MPPKRRETGETSGDPSRSPKRRRGDQPGGSQGSSPNPNNGDAFHRQLYNIGPREEGKSRLETDPAKSSNLDRYRQPYSHGKHTRFGENNTETVLKDTEDDIREYHEDNNLKTFLADATDPIQHDATVPIEPNATVTKHIKYIYIDKLEPEDRQKPQTVTRIITRDDGTKTRSAEYFQ